MLSLTLFIMAVENLYNTAVEYHSPLAAKPTSTRPPGPFPVKAQLSKHIVPQDHLCLLQQKGGKSDWRGKDPGYTAAAAAVVLVVMDSDSCLLLCVMLPSRHS